MPGVDLCLAALLRVGDSLRQLSSDTAQVPRIEDQHGWIAMRSQPDGAESVDVTETTCPASVLAALPEHMRESALANNSHLETANSKRALHAEWGTPDTERDEVRAAWIGLGYMMERALPLGPLANVTARYVRRSKLHHRDCYLLRNPSVESAPLGSISHRPYCSVCDGPGFDVSDDHLDYLWAVMAIDEVTDHLNDRLRQSHRFDGPDTLKAWQQQRRDEIDACHEVIAIVAALSLAEPRINKLAEDVTTRVRYRIAVMETKLAAGPKENELPPDHVVARGQDAIRAWRSGKLNEPPEQEGLGAVPQNPTADSTPGFTLRPASRLIHTPRTCNRVLSPSYITGITQQRVEFAHIISTAGRVHSDPALAHPTWGASYEWMAAKLAEKHPASAGRALIWGIVTNSIAHDVCDSSCGDGLPVCNLHHPYPGHASLLVQVPERRALLSDWTGWDLLVSGGYIPIDQDDSRAFGYELSVRFGDNVPPPSDWPDDLLDRAIESWIRCLRVTLDPFSRPIAGTQFVVSELRASDVVDVVQGPPLEDADRWWDRYQADHPEEAERRDRSTATLDVLRRAVQ